jgi:hypothetical protein
MAETRTLRVANTRRASSSRTSSDRLSRVDIALRGVIVGLTLATGYIHSTLGGPLFTLNAIGYAVAAIALIVPIGIAIRFRGIVRLGLIGYAATAIVAWYLTGPRYDIAYVAKAIEVVLIVVLAVDFARNDGHPIAYLRHLVPR